MTSTPICDAPTDMRAGAIAELRAFRIRAAGLRGGYASATSPEGMRVYERFAKGRGTYLYGLPGRGKTWAAACCVRMAVERGLTARLVTAKALLDAIKAEYDGGERVALGQAERCSLLALDDLGVERPTAWAMETISALIDVRVSSGLPTVVTSNYSLGDLRKRWDGMEGARLASRIAGACERVEMIGIDMRRSNDG